MKRVNIKNLEELTTKEKEVISRAKEVQNGMSEVLLQIFTLNLKIIVLDFVKESTKYFDTSHNHEHALAVYELAMDIISHEIPNFDEKLITLASLLHDVCDHKYP